jgi:hypothetical protein
MPSKYLVRVTYELSTIYTILTLSLYIFKRDATIPLTYKSTLYDWGALKKLFDANPVRLDQRLYNETLWCIDERTSPQCSCLYSAFNNTYTRNARKFLAGGGPTTQKELSDLQYTDLVETCLRYRTSYRKDTCDYWCRVHLTTPVALACLFTSLFFSRIVQYDSRMLQQISWMLPLALCLITIATHIGIDLLGGIAASISVLVALYEASFSCGCMDEAQIYWNLMRFIASPLAVWAAATQQARDIYLVASYAVLGYLIGLLAYTQYLMRFRQGCNARVRVVALYVWVGMCTVAASFLLLVQQHAYSASPMWSSLTAVLALFIICVQCIVNAPGVCLSDTLQIGTSLAVLSVVVLAVSWDTLAN